MFLKIIQHQGSTNRCVAYLASLHLLGGHDDDARVLLDHHEPEVSGGGRQTPLRRQVRPLRPLTVLFRLCKVAIVLLIILWVLTIIFVWKWIILNYTQKESVSTFKFNIIRLKTQIHKNYKVLSCFRFKCNSTFS